MIDFRMVFPPGFLWGTATAAHQVEGGNTNNNWHRWEHTRHRVFAGHTADVACDWWGGRYREDFDRAHDLYNNAHRFSIEWSRVMPEPDVVDEAALAHYADMISALRQRGMEPLVTLHHFTDPLWIDEQGGWANPDTIRHFEAYVTVVIEALGHEASMWCTINEPMVYATQGYLLGRFPPGKRSRGQAMTVAANLLRGHAAAYHAIKSVVPEAQVGFAKHQISLRTRRPAVIHTPARNAIRQFFNRAVIDALMTGTLRFPGRTIELPQVQDTFDWIGLNYYYRFLAGFSLLRPRQLFVHQSRPRAGIRGPKSVGEIWPEGLFEQIKWLAERTGKPLYITENGVPADEDDLRRLHIVRSLRSVWRALNNNYPVKGYFFWTLVDNFEWAEGYDPQFRFGLYGCDVKTQKRTQRPSAELYREICRDNALTADMVRRYVPDVFDELFPAVELPDEVALVRPSSSNDR